MQCPRRPGVFVNFIVRFYRRRRNRFTVVGQGYLVSQFLAEDASRYARMYYRPIVVDVLVDIHVPVARIIRRRTYSVPVP